jgi:hypothetical protein
MNIILNKMFEKLDILKKQTDDIFSSKSKPDTSHPCDKCSVECSRFCQVFMRAVEKPCDEEFSHNSNTRVNL